MKQNDVRGLEAVLLTIAVDHAMANELLGYFKKMPWTIAAQNLDHYISAVRRPSLAAESKPTAIRIAVVDFDKDAAKAVEAAQYLTTALVDKVTVIALAKNNDPALVLMAMRAGCSEFLYKPLDGEAIGQMLRRLATVWTNPARREKDSGTILSFFGVKGGVGTTTLAAHLAMYLVQTQKKKTLLIDNHRQLGHVCAYLGLVATGYYFHELVRNVSRLDSELLKGFVARHPEGLEVLSSPDNYSQTRDLDATAVTKTLEFLRSEYDYVLVDCDLGFDDSTVAVMQLSSRVYFVATPSFAAIRDLSRSMDRFAENNWPVEKLDVIVNRMSKTAGLDQEQIEKAIKTRVTYSIPETEGVVTQSVNLGLTVAPKTKLEFAAKLSEWAEDLTGGIAEEKPQAKKDGKFFGIWNKALSH